MLRCFEYIIIQLSIFNHLSTSSIVLHTVASSCNVTVCILFYPTQATHSHTKLYEHYITQWYSINTHTCTYTHTLTHTYTCTHTYLHACIHMHARTAHTYTHVHIHTHVYTHKVAKARYHIPLWNYMRAII